MTTDELRKKLKKDYTDLLKFCNPKNCDNAPENLLEKLNTAQSKFAGLVWVDTPSDIIQDPIVKFKTGFKRLSEL